MCLVWWQAQQTDRPVLMSIVEVRLSCPQTEPLHLLPHALARPQLWVCGGKL